MLPPHGTSTIKNQLRTTAAEPDVTIVRGERRQYLIAILRRTRRLWS
jgi:hypothetical protein